MNASTKKIALIVGIVLGATFVITGTYMIAESGKKTTDIEKSANIDGSVNAEPDVNVTAEPDVIVTAEPDVTVTAEPDVTVTAGSSKDDSTMFERAMEYFWSKILGYDLDYVDEIDSTSDSKDSKPKSDGEDSDS